MAPPLKQHGVADQLEPWGEFQTGLLEHALQFISRNVGGVANLVRAGVEVNIGLDEEDVVD